MVYGFDLRLFALFWVLLAEFTEESPRLGLGKAVCFSFLRLWIHLSQMVME